MQVGTQKKLSPALFGFALFCFLLPFATVSCNQQKVASFTGFQLVLGTTVPQPQMFGPSKMQRVDGEPLAILAFLSCLVALGLGFAKSRNTEIGAAVLAGIGVVCLLMLKSKLQDEVLRQSSDILQVNYESGYWLAVLAILAAGGLAAIAPWRSRDATTATENHPQSPP